MELIEIKLDDEDVLEEVLTAVERELPEEMKFIDSLDKPGDGADGPWNQIISVIVATRKKAFEIGFKMGQQISGRENPLPVKWVEYV